MRAFETYDAVIAGGGPAGAAAAIVLARAGCRVLLAEALDRVPFKVGETLPPATYPLLRDLGVSRAALEAASHLPCPGNVAAWGGAEQTAHDFIRDVYGAGWHLDRPRFDAALRGAARAAGAEVRTACRLVQWEFSEPRADWALSLSDEKPAARFSVGVSASANAGADADAGSAASGSSAAHLGVRSRWLLDATGRRALIAESCGAGAIRHDRLVAFCRFDHDESGGADARTFIESTPDGWWYSARLPDERRMTAFFTDDDLPAAHTARTAEGFAQLLAFTRHIRGRGHDHTLPDGDQNRIRRFPAASVSRPFFGGAGWLALGDASLAFDPLSSQGIFHALYTGLRGAETALAAMNGDAAALPAWDARLRSVHAAYQNHLAACYAAERRWPDAPFWQRRHSGESPSRASAATSAFPKPTTSFHRQFDPGSPLSTLDARLAVPSAPMPVTEEISQSVFR